MIEWGAPESDGGAPLLGYIIAIRDVKRSMWIEVGQVDANFTRLHIKELQASKTKRKLPHKNFITQNIRVLNK